MRKLKKLIYCIILFSLILSAAIFAYLADYEFLIYTIVTAFIVWILYIADSLVDYSSIIIVFFGIGALLHILGGMINVGEIRLYSLIIISLFQEPYNLLRYDQILHLYSYGLFSFMFYPVAIRYIKKQEFIALVVVLVSVGVGALNEIIEFITFLVTNTEEVGDYINNSLDLLFNLFGAMLGFYIAKIYDKIKKR